MNGRQAAIRAGYGERNAARQACRLLRVPDVAEKVRNAIEARAGKLEVEAEDVIRGVLALVRKCETTDHWSPAVALKGYEMLGKHIGMFWERPSGLSKGAEEPEGGYITFRPLGQ